MKVTLPDGSPLELPDGATGTDAAAPSARARPGHGERHRAAGGAA